MCGSPTLHRAAEPRGEAARARSAGPAFQLPTGALVGQSSAAHTSSGPHEAVAVAERLVRASRRRRRGRRGPAAPPGRSAARPRAAGPADHAGGERVPADQRSRPASCAAATSSAGTASGTSSRSSRRPPSATSVSPSCSVDTRSPSRTTASGVSSGGGERSDTSTTSAPTAAPPARRCSRRSPRSGGPLKQAGMVSVSVTHGARGRLERLAQVVDALEVEPEQVVVAVARPRPPRPR